MGLNKYIIYYKYYNTHINMRHIESTGVLEIKIKKYVHII